MVHWEQTHIILKKSKSLHTTDCLNHSQSFIVLNFSSYSKSEVSLHTLKVLSLVPDLFNAEFSSLYYLKSLKQRLHLTLIKWKQ
ncbi:hypothetical protein P8452_24623 [Trifolium repens]|nr:hypothetical protein P8452_24623 [Trifolium repens]